MRTSPVRWPLPKACKCRASCSCTACTRRSSTCGSASCGRCSTSPINETRELFGVPSVGGWRELFSRHAAAISVVTSSFDAPVDEALGNLRHFGFLVPDLPAARPELPVGDKPLVLVSLSTTFQAQDDLLDAIVEGATPYARLFVTTGGYGAVKRSDPGVIVNSFVPHSAVLPEVDLVITHGGLGTVAAALAHGVPLLCAPMGRDQHLDVEHVEATGVGSGISALASPDEIATAVERVLRDSRLCGCRAARGCDQRPGGRPIGRCRARDRPRVLSGDNSECDISRRSLLITATRSRRELRWPPRRGSSGATDHPAMVWQFPLGVGCGNA